MLPDNVSLKNDNFSCGGYNYALRCYVIFYALSNVAEILYFIVLFYLFCHNHSTPKWMHLLQNCIAISLEMPLMIASWCMLPGLPGKVNYDDVFWDMILLATFLCNTWLSMCFKLWDIFSTIQEEEDREFSAVVSWFLRPMKIIIMSSFHTIFVFTPIVYITGNFRGIANDNDTQNLMEIIRFPGKNLLLLSILYTITLLFYFRFYGIQLYVFYKWTGDHLRRCWTRSAITETHPLINVDHEDPHTTFFGTP